MASYLKEFSFKDVVELYYVKGEMEICIMYMFKRGFTQLAKDMKEIKHSDIQTNIVLKLLQDYATAKDQKGGQPNAQFLTGEQICHLFHQGAADLNVPIQELIPRYMKVACFRGEADEAKLSSINRIREMQMLFKMIQQFPNSEKNVPVVNSAHNESLVIQDTIIKVLESMQELTRPESAKNKTDIHIIVIADYLHLKPETNLFHLHNH
jgi:hypothetical protein